MKFKFQKSSIDLTSNSDKKTDLKVVFTFNATFLTNAKKIATNIKINHIYDLTIAGNYTWLDNSELLAVSLGEKESFNLHHYLKAIKSLANIINSNKNISSVSVVLEESLAKLLDKRSAQYVEFSICHLLNHLYYIDEFKSKRNTLNINAINFITATLQDKALKDALALAEGVFLIKNLGNAPANIVTPNFLAETAKDFEKISKKVNVEILNEKEIKKLKMHSFVAVAKGSTEEPKFIKIEYSGGDKSQKPIVLVGKGITFDTGGISLKPRNNLDSMKFDMCGAATVIGVLQTAIKLSLPLNVIALIPTCENMPSGNAVKPGDIVTTMSGQTVEILNTDAEGRLILCDALTYAARYKPEIVIDVATLTGAGIISLGHVATSLFSNDQELAKSLTLAGEKTNDRVWQMPLFDEYAELLDSQVADLSNISGWDGHAGAITAACFLAKFTDYKWAHLDIAGTAFGCNSLLGNSINNGATGRPFYLLMEFLRSYN